MSNFYQLSVQQQAERLTLMARDAFSHWDLPSNADIALLNYRENAVFSVSSEGKRYAMRVHRAGYHTDNALRSELQWMEALKYSGILTPDVIPTRSGDLFKNVICESVPEPRQIDLLAWIEGSALGSIGTGANGDVAGIIANYKLVGALMARLHNQAQSWVLPKGFERHVWDERGTLGDNPLWGRFWELEVLTDKQRRLIQEARSKALGELEAFGKEDDRYGLIHCDFLPENMIQQEGNIRLIDFDDSVFGWHLFDVATTLFYLLKEPYFDNVLVAFIEGYRSERALPDQHLEMLPAFFVIRSLVYLGWVHTRRETETAKLMTPMIVEGACELICQYLGH